MFEDRESTLLPRLCWTELAKGSSAWPSHFTDRTDRFSMPRSRAGAQGGLPEHGGSEGRRWPGFGRVRDKRKLHLVPLRLALKRLTHRTAHRTAPEKPGCWGAGQPCVRHRRRRPPQKRRRPPESTNQRAPRNGDASRRRRYMPKMPKDPTGSLAAVAFQS